MVRMIKAVYEVTVPKRRRLAVGFLLGWYKDKEASPDMDLGYRFRLVRDRLLLWGCTLKKVEV